MKMRFNILCVSGILLLTIGYTQILDRIVMTDLTCKVMNDSSEEPIEKSSEENNRTTDQDEDPFWISEITITSPESLPPSTKSESYIFGISSHYPEIVAPPPQA